MRQLLVIAILMMPASVLADTLSLLSQVDGVTTAPCDVGVVGVPSMSAVTRVATCSNTIGTAGVSGTAQSTVRLFDAQGYSEIDITSGLAVPGLRVIVQSGAFVRYIYVNQTNTPLVFSSLFAENGSVTKSSADAAFTWTSDGNGTLSAWDTDGSLTDTQTCEAVQTTFELCTATVTVPALGQLLLDVYQATSATYTAPSGTQLNSFTGIVDFGRSFSVESVSVTGPDGNPLDPNTVFSGTFALPVNETPEPGTGMLATVAVGAAMLVKRVRRAVRR